MAVPASHLSAFLLRVSELRERLRHHSAAAVAIDSEGADGPWAAVVSHVDRVEAELRPLEGLTGHRQAQLQLQAALAPLTSLLEQLQALLVQPPTSPHSHQLLQRLPSALHAQMVRLAVQLNTAPKQRWGSSGQRREELRLLLDLMKRVLSEEEVHSASEIHAQTQRMRERYLSSQGRDEAQERREEQRRAALPLAQRLPADKIIAHSELLYSSSGDSATRQGGYGRVLKGVWKRMGPGRPVAIKLPFRLNEAEERQRFEEEVVLLYKLKGEPNIVNLLAVCIDEGHEAIVMDYLQGDNLLERLRAARANPQRYGLQWEDRLQLAMDIVQGVNALHTLEPKVMHRDLKSNNVLLDQWGRAYITDFGLSRFEHREEEGAEFFSFAPHKLACTAWWRCPEQNMPLKKRYYNAACDVFSIGMVLYELATLRVPWGDRTAEDAAELIFRGYRPRIDDDVPEWFAGWIQRCWSHDVNERPLCLPLLEEMQSIKQQLREERRSLQAMLPVLQSLLPRSRAGLPLRLTPVHPAVGGPSPRSVTPTPPSSRIPHQTALGAASQPRRAMPVPLSIDDSGDAQFDSSAAAAVPFSLPARVRGDAPVQFRGQFREGERQVAFLAVLRFERSHPAKGRVRGCGLLEMGPFQLEGRWEVVDSCGWKLRLSNCSLDLQSGERRRVHASSVQQLPLAFEGKWQDVTETPELIETYCSLTHTRADRQAHTTFSMLEVQGTDAAFAALHSPHDDLPAD